MAGDLVDKLLGLPAAGDDKIPAHTFRGGLYFWAWGDWTRSTLISKLSVYGMNEVEDGAQLDWLATTYTGLAGDAKLHFFMRVENACVLGESGVIDKTEFLALVNAS